MITPTIDPTLPFEQQLQAWYNHLDAFISAEEKVKGNGPQAEWAAEVNTGLLEPIQSLFTQKFGSNLPLKIQMLETNPKVKKDDHIKRLKANRYNIFTYQRKAYLEQIGDLS